MVFQACSAPGPYSVRTGYATVHSGRRLGVQIYLENPFLHETSHENGNDTENGPESEQGHQMFKIEHVHLC